MKPNPDVRAKINAKGPREHGTRCRYINYGCRCLPCCRANSIYASQRRAARMAGDWRDLVPLKKARNHILRLNREGLGSRSIAIAADLAYCTVQKVKRGRGLIRRNVERSILQVTADAISDFAKVPAGPTWKIIDALVADGYTKKQLGAWFTPNRARHRLVIGRNFVTAKTALRVRQLAAKIEMGLFTRET